MNDFDARVLAAIPCGGTTIKRIRFVLGSQTHTSKIERAVKRLAEAGAVTLVDKHRVERR